jgi:hypothetical protein
MSTGLLGRSLLPAANNTVVYTVPSGKNASITVSFCNQSSSAPAKVKLAITELATATANSWIEFNADIPVNGVLERGAIILGPNEKVIAVSNSADVSVNVYGIEESST